MMTWYLSHDLWGVSTKGSVQLKGMVEKREREKIKQHQLLHFSMERKKIIHWLFFDYIWSCWGILCKADDFQADWRVEDKEEWLTVCEEREVKRACENTWNWTAPTILEIVWGEGHLSNPASSWGVRIVNWPLYLLWHVYAVSCGRNIFVNCSICPSFSERVIIVSLHSPTTLNCDKPQKPHIIPSASPEKVEHKHLQVILNPFFKSRGRFLTGKTLERHKAGCSQLFKGNMVWEKVYF